LVFALRRNFVVATIAVTKNPFCATRGAVKAAGFSTWNAIALTLVRLRSHEHGLRASSVVVAFGSGFGPQAARLGSSTQLLRAASGVLP